MNNPRPKKTLLQLKASFIINDLRRIAGKTSVYVKAIDASKFHELMVDLHAEKITRAEARDWCKQQINLEQQREQTRTDSTSPTRIENGDIQKQTHH